MAGENNNLVRGLGIGAVQLVGDLAIDSSGSNNHSLILAKLTSTQRDAISSPATGLMIYNTTTNKLNFFDGSAWEAVTSA
jgi:hypothetical protein